MSNKKYEPVKDYERDLGWIIRNEKLFDSLLNDERRRKVIRDKFIKGLSTEEIGSKIDLSQQRVQQLYLSGLHKLKENAIEQLQTKEKIRELERENAELAKKVVRLELCLQVQDKDTALKSTDTSLANLDGISVRTLNALRAHDVNTVEDLVTCGRADVLKFRNIGAKGVDELSEALSQYEVTWR